MAKTTTELQIKVTADARGATSGLAPVNTGLTELAANAEKGSAALAGLAGAHNIEINDSEIKAVSEEISKLQVQMREGLRSDPQMNTAPIRKQISGLRSTLKELQKPVEVPVKVENIDSVTSGERALSDLGRVAATSFPALNNVGFALTSVGKVSPVVKAGVAGIGAAFGTWKVAKLAADVQTTQLQLKALTGSTASAASTFQDLQKFAADTPFELDQVTAAARALLVAGKTPSQLPATLTEIGNVATATGVPLEQMSVVFEQMFTKGKIANEELLQLAEAGVPVYQTLAKQLGTTTAGVQDMAQKGQIGADQIDKLIENLGNLFPTSMSDQAKSFNGQLSTLHDTAEQLGQGIGAQVLPEMQSLVQLMQDTLGVVSKLPGPIKAIGTTFAAVAIGQKVFGGTIDKASLSLTKLKEKMAGTEGIGNKLKVGLGGVASAFNPWTLAITGGVALLSIWAQKQAEAKQESDDLAASLDQQTGAVTKNTRAVAAKKLQDKGAFEAANAMGISIGLVTSAALGNKDAIAKVNDQMQTYSDVKRKLDENKSPVTLGQDLGQVSTLRNLIEDTSGTIADQAQKIRELHKATSDTSSTDAAGASMKELGQDVKDTSKAYKDLLDNFTTLNDAMIESQSTVFDYQGALDDLRTSLAKGDTFAPGAEQGRANWDALVKVADTANDRIVNTLKTKGTAAAQVVYTNSRNTLHNILTNAGVQSKQAWDLVDRVLKKPHKMHVELEKINISDWNKQLARLEKRRAKIKVAVDPGANATIADKNIHDAFHPIDEKINAVTGKIDGAKADLAGVANPGGKGRDAKINAKIDPTSLAFAHGQLATLVEPRTAYVNVVTRHVGAGAPAGPTTPGPQPDRIITPQSVIPSGNTQSAPGQAVQLAPKVTPVKVFLDGAEIADHLTLRTQRISLGRRVA